MNDQHSILQLILDAGPVVKAIIAMLLLASLVSWTIIFRKRRLVSQAESEANRFEGVFWSGGDLGKLYRSIGARNQPPVGMESIFEAGFGEFTRLRSQSVPAGELLEGVRRTMRVA
ncbi:MAG: protein TolQ, partial [Burkholderiales bacterium]